jgi:hypothetical protein
VIADEYQRKGYAQPRPVCEQARVYSGIIDRMQPSFTLMGASRPSGATPNCPAFMPSVDAGNTACR